MFEAWLTNILLGVRYSYGSGEESCPLRTVWRRLILTELDPRAWFVDVVGHHNIAVSIVDDGRPCQQISESLRDFPP